VRSLPRELRMGLGERLAAPTLFDMSAIALIMTVVTWPGMDLVPQAGLDSSWHAGLVMALEQHIAWGPRMDFTYGPLGFLVVPNLYNGTTPLLSLCYLLLTRVSFFLLLLRASYRKFPSYLALASTLIVGATAMALVEFGDLLMGIELLLASEALQLEERRIRYIAILTLGTVAGAGLLVKFSVGLLGIGLMALVVAATATHWRRHFAVAVGAFIVALLGGWVATSNSNLLEYVHMSVAIVAGYSGAMSYEVGARVDEWYYAAIVLVCLAVCAFAVLHTIERRAQLCMTVAFLGYSWVALKEGYVRHDTHDLEFFSFMLVAFLALPWPKLGGPTTLLACSLSLTTVLTWAAAGSVPSNLLDFSYDTHQLASSLSTVLSSSRLASTIAQARTSLQAGYHVPPSFLAEMRGQTVAIEPYENTVAWAYQDFTWDPEPVLQQYTAYEPVLDNLDARFLLSDEAPTRILVQPPGVYQAIDQDTYFNAPTADLDLLCRYVQIGATATWQLLARVPNRCGRLRLLGTVRA